jgi:hypothetical protein
MALLDTGEPFGLPKGTVRGVIALVALGLLVFSYVATKVIDPTVLAFAGPFLGFYFGTRPGEPVTVVEPPLAPPSLAEDIG